MCFFYLMIRQLPRYTRTDPFLPYTTHFRSCSVFQASASRTSRACVLVASPLLGNAGVDVAPLRMEVEHCDDVAPAEVGAPGQQRLQDVAEQLVVRRFVQRPAMARQIGRASCRERVCQYV